MKKTYQSPKSDLLAEVPQKDLLTNSPVWDYTDPENDKDDIHEDNF